MIMKCTICKFSSSSLSAAMTLLPSGSFPASAAVLAAASGAAASPGVIYIYIYIYIYMI
jgi:hypothetical protein